MGPSAGAVDRAQQKMDEMKVAILGGRSGTSTLARILESSGLRLWGSETGGTEPPGLADTILYNLDKPEKIRNALQFQDWDIAKCPEFAFCSELVLSAYPEIKFIWLDRPISERVQSHVNLGWHYTIDDNLKKIKTLRAFLKGATKRDFSDNPSKNDLIWFDMMDCFNDSFYLDNEAIMLRIHYADFNNLFEFTMRRISAFLGIEYNEQWKNVKNKKHQAGRWSPK